MGELVRLRGKPRDGEARRQPLPSRVSIAVFHVRDLETVKKVVAAPHSRPGRKRRATARRARDREQSPLYLADDNHLVAVGPTRAWATTARRAIERALGDAVDYVETRSIRIPKEVRDAWIRGAGTAQRRGR